MKKNRLNREYKKAFTLAEVLITLAVIGVVASMTIPTMLSSTNNAEYVTGLKKFYAIGNQALQQMALDAGCIGDLGCTGLFSNGLNHLGDGMASYFNVVKNCKSEVDQDCVSTFNRNFDGSSVTNYDFNTANTYYKFVTADGMTIAIYNYNNACTTDFGLNSNSPTAKVCGYLDVDVNGKKGPNNRGRDVFEFLITSNKAPLLYPTGGLEENFGGAGVTEGDKYWNYNNNNDCSSSGDKAGTFCTGRLIENGWEMDY